MREEVTNRLKQAEADLRSAWKVRFCCPYCGRRQTIQTRGESVLTCRKCQGTIKIPTSDVPCFMCGLTPSTNAIDWAYVTTAFVGGISSCSSRFGGTEYRISYLPTHLVRFTVPVCASCLRAWWWSKRGFSLLVSIGVGSLLGSLCLLYFADFGGPWIYYVIPYVLPIFIVGIFIIMHGSDAIWDKVGAFLRRETAESDLWEFTVDFRPNWHWTPSAELDSESFNKCRRVEVHDFESIEWVNFKSWISEHRLVSAREDNPLWGTVVHKLWNPEAHDLVQDPRKVLDAWSKRPDGVRLLQKAIQQLRNDVTKEEICCNFLKEANNVYTRSLLQRHLQDHIEKSSRRLRILKITFFPVGFLCIVDTFLILLFNKMLSEPIQAIMDFSSILLGFALFFMVIYLIAELGNLRRYRRLVHKSE